MSRIAGRHERWWRGDDRLRPRLEPRRFRLPWGAALALLAVGALAATLALTGAGNGGAGQPASRRPGTPAPALAGRTLTGESFDLAASRGQVVLVNVFASWCGPCRTELPLLVGAQRRWSARGLRIVGVDVRDSTESVRALLDETGADEFTVLPDPDGATAVDWGAHGVPETFLVDRDGRIAGWEPGPLTTGWLDERLPPLLSRAA